MNAEKITWEVTTNVEGVHLLLQESDKYNATSEAPAPVRNLSTTRFYVGSKAVELLKENGELLGMFTLILEPPFKADLSIYPEVRKAAYMCRLCINPKFIKTRPFVGVQCVRRAIEKAAKMGCDGIRCEINPDLEHVKKMLDILGFHQCGNVIIENNVKKAYMQKLISSFDI